MLKTRQIPARKVLIDRSDIVALHAKVLRRKDDGGVVVRREIRRAENLVTVLTYGRTNCPLLNQVSRRCDAGSVA